MDSFEMVGFDTVEFDLSSDGLMIKQGEDVLFIPRWAIPEFLRLLGQTSDANK